MMLPTFVEHFLASHNHASVMLLLVLGPQIFWVKVWGYPSCQDGDHTYSGLTLYDEITSNATALGSPVKENINADTSIRSIKSTQVYYFMYLPFKESVSISITSVHGIDPIQLGINVKVQPCDKGKSNCNMLNHCGGHWGRAKILRF